MAMTAISVSEVRITTLPVQSLRHGDRFLCLLLGDCTTNLVFHLGESDH